MTSGIIHHEDIRDDDWIMLFPRQFECAQVLHCQCGRAPVSKIQNVGDRDPPGYVFFIRREDHVAVRALCAVLGKPTGETAYGFRADDPDIELAHWEQLPRGVE